jgi:hypothetical protein
MMNEIYVNYWKPLQNFFLPTFKLKEKIRVGAKIKKIYDTPKTPINRLLDSKYLTQNKKDKLIKRKKELNPFDLKKGLENKLSSFFKAVHMYNYKRKQNNEF